MNEAFYGVLRTSRSWCRITGSYAARACWGEIPRSHPVDFTTMRNNALDLLCKTRSDTRTAANDAGRQWLAPPPLVTGGQHARDPCHNVDKLSSDNKWNICAINSKKIVFVVHSTCRCRLLHFWGPLRGEQSRTAGHLVHYPCAQNEYSVSLQNPPYSCGSKIHSH